MVEGAPQIFARKFTSKNPASYAAKNALRMFLQSGKLPPIVPLTLSARKVAPFTISKGLMHDFLV